MGTLSFPLTYSVRARSYPYFSPCRCLAAVTKADARVARLDSWDLMVSPSMEPQMCRLSHRDFNPSRAACLDPFFTPGMRSRRRWARACCSGEHRWSFGRSGSRRGDGRDQPQVITVISMGKRAPAVIRVTAVGGQPANLTWLAQVVIPAHVEVEFVDFGHRADIVITTRTKRSASSATSERVSASSKRMAITSHRSLISPCSCSRLGWRMVDASPTVTEVAAAQRRWSTSHALLVLTTSVSEACALLYHRSFTSRTRTNESHGRSSKSTARRSGQPQAGRWWRGPARHCRAGF